MACLINLLNNGVDGVDGFDGVNGVFDNLPFFVASSFLFVVHVLLVFEVMSKEESCVSLL